MRSRRKACGRLCIRHNWNFFAISYGWDVISGNPLTSSFFEEGSLLANISGGRGQFPAIPVEVERWKINPCFIWCWDTDRRLFRFVTIHASDRQTDRNAMAISCVALHAVAWWKLNTLCQHTLPRKVQRYHSTSIYFATLRLHICFRH